MRKKIFLSVLISYVVILFFAGLPEIFLEVPLMRPLKNTASLFPRATSILPGMELFRKKRFTDEKITSECLEAKTLNASGKLTKTYRTDDICQPPAIRIAANVFQTSLIRIFQEIENMEQEKISLEKRDALIKGLSQFFCQDQSEVRLRFRKTKARLSDLVAAPASNIVIDYACATSTVKFLKFYIKDDAPEVAAYEAIK